MARVAVILPSTRAVVNIIEAEPDFVLDGFNLVPSDTASMGEVYNPEIGEFEAGPVVERPVPASVTNFQARAVMRQVFLPDGRSLFTAVNEDLAAARTALADREDSDPEKTQAEIAWQAWEQANEYLRNGPLVMSLAARYGFDTERTDDLFRQAEQVIA